MGGDACKPLNSAEDEKRCEPSLLDNIPESRLSTEGIVRPFAGRRGCRFAYLRLHVI